jgi:hypothetical protein
MTRLIVSASIVLIVMAVAGVVVAMSDRVGGRKTDSAWPQMSDRVSARKTDFVWPPRVVPYTVTLQEKVRGENGTFVKVSRQVFALRSDGATARIVEMLRPDFARANRYITLPEGLRIHVNDVREEVTTMITDRDSLALALRDPSSRCTRSISGQAYPYAEVISNSADIMGFKSVAITNTEGYKIAYAPDLSCALVGQVVTQSGQPVSWVEATDIRQGEPESFYFEVPHHYVRLTPSAYFRHDVDSPMGQVLDSKQAKSNRRR